MNIFQLKEHGETGQLGEPAQAHVTVRQLIVEQEMLLGVQHHVQAMTRKWQLAAKVI